MMTAHRRELIALGRTIRQLRTERNITEGELATAAGLTLGRLAAIEAGRFDLRLDVLFALAHELSVKPGPCDGKHLRTPGLRVGECYQLVARDIIRV
jgi:transcriptional regulator with XRE-family HTH domain